MADAKPTRSGGTPIKQQGQVVLRIQEMILQGRLAPGDRLTEAAVAAQLGLSRTPVRQALPLLAQEGVLVPFGSRGYRVREFTAAEIDDALEMRGVLEGLAAKTIADKGIPRMLLHDLRDCLAQGDAIFARGAIAAGDERAYGQMNARFHDLILSGSERKILIDAVRRLHSVPFLAPETIAFGNIDPAQITMFLSYAHRQHHAVVDALESGDGARAAFLMQEHVHAQRRSLNLERAGA